MFSNSTMRSIEWGECDAAGIVYYPRYLEMLNEATLLLVARASGIRKGKLLEMYGIIGYPIVRSETKFHVPNRFDDEITIESAFAKIGTSSFEVSHRITRDGRLTVEACDKHVWVGRDPADASQVKSLPIPRELVMAFRGDRP